MGSLVLFTRLRGKSLLVPRLSGDDILTSRDQEAPIQEPNANPSHQPDAREDFPVVNEPHPNHSSELLWRKLTKPKQFRLLGLRVNGKDDGVRKPEWFVSQFDLDDCPQYLALSYTWRGQASTELLQCESHTISVTKTVSTFLHTVFAPSFLDMLQPDGSDHVFLWIDAICIDQNDVEEKSSQVRLISEIFSRAKKVIGWLGEANAESELALTFLSNLKVYFDGMYNSHPLEDINSAIAITPYRETLNSDELVALSRFLGNPYFSRTWIIQEIAVAQSLLLQLGPHSLDWDAFANVCLHIVVHPSVFFGFSFPTEIIWVYEMRQIYKESSLSLFDLPSRVLQFQSHDPRDQIFALLGITDEKENNELQPDYSRRTEEVYQAFAICAFRKGLLPAVLACITPRTSFDQLPSWVPDWSRSDRNKWPLKNQSFAAGGTANINAQLEVEDLTLSIVGAVIGQVEKMVQTPNVFHARAEDWLSSPDPAHMPRLRREQCERTYNWMEECDRLATDVFEGRKTGDGGKIDPAANREAFWRTMICDRDLNQEQAGPQFAQYFEDFRQLLVEEMENVVAELTSEKRQQDHRSRAYGACLGAAVLHRALAYTKSLALAVIPDAALPEDEICVFQGLATPFVIRARGDGSYRILGEAYVHGIMDGEAMEAHKEELRNIVIK